MKPATHLQIDQRLCGAPGVLEPGVGTAVLETTDEMAVDGRGLVHGGFVFGLADHAAMLAVNDPNVVLGHADVRFLAPVRVGERVVATASVIGVKGRKHTLEVSASVGERMVLTGTLTAFVLDGHVLDG